MRVCLILGILLAPFQAAAEQVTFRVGSSLVTFRDPQDLVIRELDNGVVISLGAVRSQGFWLGPAEDSADLEPEKRVTMADRRVEYRLAILEGGSGGPYYRFEGRIVMPNAAMSFTCFGQREPLFARPSPAWLETFCLDIAQRLEITG